METILQSFQDMISFIELLCLITAFIIIDKILILFNVTVLKEKKNGKF